MRTLATLTLLACVACGEVGREGLVVEGPSRIRVERAEEGRFHHAFRLRNASDRRIDLSRLVPSCRCAEAEPSRYRLAPGESVTVAVTGRIRPEERSAAALVDVFWESEGGGLEGVTQLELRHERGSASRLAVEPLALQTPRDAGGPLRLELRALRYSPSTSAERVVATASFDAHIGVRPLWRAIRGSWWEEAFQVDLELPDGAPASGRAPPVVRLALEGRPETSIVVPVRLLETEIRPLVMPAVLYFPSLGGESVTRRLRLNVGGSITGVTCEGGGVTVSHSDRELAVTLDPARVDWAGSRVYRDVVVVEAGGRKEGVALVARRDS